MASTSAASSCCPPIGLPGVPGLMVRVGPLGAGPLAAEAALPAVPMPLSSLPPAASFSPVDDVAHQSPALSSRPYGVGVGVVAPGKAVLVGSLRIEVSGTMPDVVVVGRAVLVASPSSEGSATVEAVGAATDGPSNGSDAVAPRNGASTAGAAAAVTSGAAAAAAVNASGAAATSSGAAAAAVPANPAPAAPASAAPVAVAAVAAIADAAAAASASAAVAATVPAMAVSEMPPSAIVYAAVFALVLLSSRLPTPPARPPSAAAPPIAWP